MARVGGPSSSRWTLMICVQRPPPHQGITGCSALAEHDATEQDRTVSVGTLRRQPSQPGIKVGAGSLVTPALELAQEASHSGFALVPARACSRPFPGGH